jgi:hypothetical protein
MHRCMCHVTDKIDDTASIARATTLGEKCGIDSNNWQNDVPPVASLDPAWGSTSKYTNISESVIILLS